MWRRFAPLPLALALLGAPGAQAGTVVQCGDRLHYTDHAEKCPAAAPGAEVQLTDARLTPVQVLRAPHSWGSQGAYLPVPDVGVHTRLETRGGQPFLVIYQDGVEVYTEGGGAIPRR